MSEQEDSRSERLHFVKQISVGQIIASAVQIIIVVWVVSAAYAATNARIDTNTREISRLDREYLQMENTVRMLGGVVQTQEVWLTRINENVLAIREYIEREERNNAR